MKKQIMTIAWAIAKEAAAQHGGSSKQYISAAMKQAWAQVRARETATVEVVEVKVTVEEVKVAAPKAPKKKKSTGGIDFEKYMNGNSAGYTKGEKITRKPFETAAEKRKRRAANPEMYTSKPKRAPKGKAGAELAAKYMDGITNNMRMGL